MRTVLLLGLVVLAAADGRAGDRDPVLPFELDGPPPSTTPLDDVVRAAWRRRGIEGARPCADAVFVRRAFLDAIGTLPEPSEVRDFLRDDRPGKRARLVDALLAREEYAEYWAMKWCDLLRVKGEFPINLWPNAVQAYHRWIRGTLRENRPFDAFARDLLTSSGSNFRVPPANFWRAVQNRSPAGLAQAVALTFMGVRYERWPEARRAGMAAFFSRVAYKRTVEWKEEIVCLDPAPTGPLAAVFPDDTPIEVPAGRDPRVVFADWLISPGNPWFARNIVNRVWAWLFGRGIVHEPDDHRPDNPPSLPEVLTYLERELVLSGYDLKHVFRTIMNSAVYQQSPIARKGRPGTEVCFPCYPVRRLEAEVLIDALCWISGAGETYVSQTPEPFTFIPDTERSISLADGSITSPFLEMFGRPARDTGLESERSNQPTDAQRLHLLNSTDVQSRIDRSIRLRRIFETARNNPREAYENLYLTLLSREPTEAEVAAAADYAKTSRLPGNQVAQDLAWALINSKEFLYRH